MLNTSLSRESPATAITESVSSSVSACKRRATGEPPANKLTSGPDQYGEYSSNSPHQGSKGETSDAAEIARLREIHERRRAGKVYDVGLVELKTPRQQ